MALSNSTDRFNGVLSTLAIKAPCAAVAIANITLSGEQTVNGVAVVAGDRVLVTAQTSAVDNGIYDASSSAWTRSADFDGNRDVVSGTFVTVATATVGRNPYYQITTADPITIGNTAINFTLADGPNVSYALTASEILEGLTDSDIDKSFEPYHVRRYGGTDGGVLTTAIQKAIDSLPADGEVVEVDVVGGTFGAITMDSPGEVRFGYGTFTLTSAASAGINIGSDKRVIISGQRLGLTTLKGSLSGQKIIQYSGLHTASDSDDKYTAVQDLTLDGDGLAEYGIFSPDTSGSFTWQNGQKVFQRLRVAGFETVGIEIGSSGHFTYIHLCDISDNATGLKTGQFADTTIFQSQFGEVRSGPLYHCFGTQIRIIDSTFIGEGDASNLGPDIRFSGAYAGAGTVFVSGTYFGPENDHASRYKIEFSESSSTTAEFGDFDIVNNWFFGVTGQTAILVEQPLRDGAISENLFKTFTRIINDNQLVVSGSRPGRCKFLNNRITSPATSIVQKIFENGGRHFDQVDYPMNVSGRQAPDDSILVLQNKLHEAAATYTTGGSYGWSLINSATLTTGQTDSKGGTDAVLITAPGSVAGEYARIRIEETGLLDDEGITASGHNGRVVVRFGAKSGNLTALDVAIADATAGTLYIYSVALTAAWKNHEVIITGINPSNITRIGFYPGISNAVTGGTVNIEFVSVSDLGSEFVGTTGGDISLIGDALSVRTLVNGATPNVVGRQRETFLTGGTTTITDLLGGNLGDERTILSEHAITITDGTNLFLAGSANFVMASTDSLTVIRKADGNWYEVSRSVN